jgi:hypothetical protein
MVAGQEDQARQCSGENAGLRGIGGEFARDPIAMLIVWNGRVMTAQATRE